MFLLSSVKSGGYRQSMHVILSFVTMSHRLISSLFGLQHAETTYSKLRRLFKKMFWRTWVIFVEPLMTLVWSSGDVSLGFQSCGGYLSCVLCCLCAMDTSDSPLVQHLLTSWCQHGNWVIWSTYLHKCTGGTRTQNSVWRKVELLNYCHVITKTEWTHYGFYPINLLTRVVSRWLWTPCRDSARIPRSRGVRTSRRSCCPCCLSPLRTYRLYC